MLMVELFFIHHGKDLYALTPPKPPPKITIRGREFATWGAIFFLIIDLVYTSHLELQMTIAKKIKRGNNPDNLSVRLFYSY